MIARRPKPTLPPDQLTVVWQSASLLLDYPDQSLLARAGLLRSAAAGLPPAIGDSLRGFLDHLEATPLPVLRASVYALSVAHRR